MYSLSRIRMTFLSFSPPNSSTDVFFNFWENNPSNAIYKKSILQLLNLLAFGLVAVILEE